MTTQCHRIIEELLHLSGRFAEKERTQIEMVRSGREDSKTNA